MVVLWVQIFWYSVWLFGVEKSLYKKWMLEELLEPPCGKKRQKKVQTKTKKLVCEIEDIWRLWMMIKKVTHANLGPIWYHSEPSNVPYSPNFTDK